jgi:hypothetical protein
LYEDVSYERGFGFVHNSVGNGSFEMVEDF